MTRFLLAHDIGTTGNKATLYSQYGELIASISYKYPTYYPEVGWAEQEPEDWWQAVCVSTKQLIEQSGIRTSQIESVSFSAQMQGVVSVDYNGNLLRKAIIWADMRAEQEADHLRHRLGLEKVYQITGHRISSSYSGSKIVWIKNHQPEIYQATYKHLHVKDYLIYKLTGKFGTDFSDASGMNLLDISNKKWSEEIIEEWEIDIDKLPDLYPSSHIIGEVTSKAAEETGLSPDTPVVMGGGDGSCAAVGAGIVDEGDIFNYIGSSSWISLSSTEPIYDKEMRTFTFVHLDDCKYLPCGTMQAAGASFQWMGDRIFRNEENHLEPNETIYDLMNREASTSQPGSNQLLFLPYMMGERSPWWNPKAKGAFIGLNIKHNRGDMVRAILEGITMNLRVILDTFRENGVRAKDMWVFGGGATSSLWRQMLADIYGVNIRIPQLLDEITSMGAAIAGGVGTGLIKDFSVSKKWVQQQHHYTPNQDNLEVYNKVYPLFVKSYKSLVPIYKELSK
ncbi:xylulokinase [Salinibacillus kushneri]|uniref:Xylulose kinase n=1 Tax=Salinibacillus kushneri TaxID=237682 RepID=A0A1H9Z1X1_9BACI|nr:xylulokinase [Salinibacillus kushneri]SES75477.1 xylulokinase [Salinibacillus kushneri]